MTREEAIRKLQKQKAEYLEEWVDFSGVAEAIDMAIESLQTEGENGEGVVAYVCDNRKCGGDCDNCGRTTDIAHAKNFTRISDSYFERLDSLSVVRCKDCRHRDLFSCPLADNDFQKDDDYCSWGERREE